MLLYVVWFINISAKPNKFGLSVSLLNQINVYKVSGTFFFTSTFYPCWRDELLGGSYDMYEYWIHLKFSLCYIHLDGSLCLTAPISIVQTQNPTILLIRKQQYVYINRFRMFHFIFIFIFPRMSLNVYEYEIDFSIQSLSWWVCALCTYKLFFFFFFFVCCHVNCKRWPTTTFWLLYPIKLLVPFILVLCFEQETLRSVYLSRIKTMLAFWFLLYQLSFVLFLCWTICETKELFFFFLVFLLATKWFIK